MMMGAMIGQTVSGGLARRGIGKSPVVRQRR
jgi:hypothetical protein